MEYKRIEDLSITECIEKIQIKWEDAKSVAASSKNKDNAYQSLSNISETEISEIRTFVINRLAELLLKDKASYLACKNKSAYQAYLSSWVDGLWRNEAGACIKRIEDAEKEFNYYDRNKGSIAGLNRYLSSYPRGKYADSARQLLNSKKRKRNIKKISISAIVTLVIALLCYTNYHSVSYINALENVSFSKKGGSVSCTISTDALGSNIQLLTSADWIEVDKNGKDFAIAVAPNHEQEQLLFMLTQPFLILV